MGSDYIKASKEQLLGWIISNKVWAKLDDSGNITVFKFNDKTKKPIELVKRIQTRKGSNLGSYRIDVRFNNYRISTFVSHIVWMQNTHQLIPFGYEIHHLNEDPTDDTWENLIAVHALDHNKLHQNQSEIPF